MVYISTIGYIADDPGYQRFFSYISLFSFAMLVPLLLINLVLLYFWLGRRGFSVLFVNWLLVQARKSQFG